MEKNIPSAIITVYGPASFSEIKDPVYLSSDDECTEQEDDEIKKED